MELERVDIFHLKYGGRGPSPAHDEFFKSLAGRPGEWIYLPECFGVPPDRSAQRKVQNSISNMAKKRGLVLRTRSTTDGRIAVMLIRESE